MKFLSRIFILAAVVLFSLQWCDAAGNALIKAVDFNEVKLDKAVKYLQRNYNMNVVLHATPQEIATAPKVNLHLKQIPPYALIKYLCLVTGMNFKIEGDLVIIAANIKHSKPFRPDKFKKDPLKDVPYGTGMRIGKTYYVPESYSPPTVVVSGNTTIVKSATPKSFRKMETGASMGRGPSQLTIQQPTKMVEKEAGPAVLEWKQEYPDLRMVNRLRNVSDVSVDVDDKPLADVIEYLRRITVKYDRRKLGVNFIIKPFPGLEKLKVTCYFNRLNMLDTLKYVCNAAGVKYQLDRDAVIIYKD